ncbi:MAG: hypothetical protein ACU0BB_05260 [Paracoccaceae bacterium]
MRYLMFFPLIALLGCDVMQDTAQEVTGIFRRDPEELPVDPGALLPAPEGLSESELPPIEEVEAIGPDTLTAAGAATVAGLGDPAKPGLWLETPLVGKQQAGRVVLQASGMELGVTLIPIEGEATAGSSLSLQAMRVLGAPLTELVELTIYPAS